MTKVVEILPKGSWAVETAVDVFIGDYEERHRRRMMLSLKSGGKVMLDLAHARLLRAGEGLMLDDHRVVLVEAQPEALMEVTSQGSLQLLRLAWHLGNRHLPVAIDEHRLLVRRDHVIADMISKLGGHVRMLDAPFDPESGAYAERDDVHGHHHHGSGHHHHYSHD
ncbi:MAG: urease accessory protein UreE [Acetobacter sp.]|jgi:urease accessory protein|nr:urease accessory protein UreE [Acetobacter sp.]MCI1530798.1 urease accessory protein UreE [Acetobacter sp.]MCI1587471.1 urease accessory protein UreE [Acetobacter sp.]